MLATVAEEGRARGSEGRKAIKEYMKPFKERHIKDIILGCTHYPIYDEIIREELGYPVNLINTGEAVSKVLKERLISYGLEGSKEAKFKQVIFSGDTTGIRDLM